MINVVTVKVLHSQYYHNLQIHLVYADTFAQLTNKKPSEEGGATGGASPKQDKDTDKKKEPKNDTKEEPDGGDETKEDNNEPKTEEIVEDKKEE